MNDVYLKIEALCSEKRIDITTMCKEAKISRAVLSEFKMGRTKKLSTDTLAKIAKYFSVSFDYLVERNYPSNIEMFDKKTGERTFPKSQDESEQKEKAPIRDEDLKIAFWGSPDEDDDLLEDVRNYAQFVKQRKEAQRKKDDESK